MREIVKNTTDCSYININGEVLIGVARCCVSGVSWRKSYMGSLHRLFSLTWMFLITEHLQRNITLKGMRS